MGKETSPPRFTQFEFGFFFLHYSTLWVLKESIYNKNVVPRAVFEIESNFNGHFFLYTLYFGNNITNTDMFKKNFFSVISDLK